MTSEKELQAAIIEVAQDWLGWEVLHIRPALKQNGRWVVPVQGKLGKGWPDLFMVKRGRALAAELKSDTGKPTEEQVRVLASLKAGGVETHIWRPADWDDIVGTLR